MTDDASHLEPASVERIAAWAKAERLWMQGMSNLHHLADATGLLREELVATSIMWAKPPVRKRR